MNQITTTVPSFNPLLFNSFFISGGWRREAKSHIFFTLFHLVIFLSFSILVCSFFIKQASTVENGELFINLNQILIHHDSKFNDHCRYKTINLLIDILVLNIECCIYQSYSKLYSCTLHGRINQPF